MSGRGLLDMPVPTLKENQEVQDPMDRHDDNYDNDVADNWLRGGGPGQAEGKPSFDKHRAGR